MIRHLWHSFRALLIPIFPHKGDGVHPWEKEGLERHYHMDSDEYRIADETKDKRVLSLFREMAKKAGHQTPPILFIYKAEQPNGSTLPSGRIFISNGAIEKCSDESLKAIIAHELTHGKNIWKNLGANFFFTSTAVLGSAYLTQKAIKLTKLDTKKNSLLHILSIVTIMPLLYPVMKRITNVPLLAISRSLELEADKGAFELAGYEAVKNKLLVSQKLEIEAGLDKRDFVEDLKRTHPHAEDRLRYIEKLQREKEAREHQR